MTYDELMDKAVYKANLRIGDTWFTEITHYFDNTMTELARISTYCPDKIMEFPGGCKWSVDRLRGYCVIPI